MNAYTAISIATLIALVIGAGIFVIALAIEANKKPNHYGIADYVAWALSPLPLFTFIGVLTILN